MTLRSKVVSPNQVEGAQGWEVDCLSMVGMSLSIMLPLIITKPWEVVATVKEVGDWD